MLTGEKSIQDQEWQSNMKFICTVGHKQWYNKNNMNASEVVYQPCTSFVRYKRADDNDEISPYILVEYSITHTHSMNYYIIQPKF